MKVYRGLRENLCSRGAASLGIHAPAGSPSVTTSEAVEAVYIHAGWNPFRTISEAVRSAALALSMHTKPPLSSASKPLPRCLGSSPQGSSKPPANPMSAGPIQALSPPGTFVFRAVEAHSGSFTRRELKTVRIASWGTPSCLFQLLPAASASSAWPRATGSAFPARVCECHSLGTWRCSALWVLTMILLPAEVRTW